MVYRSIRAVIWSMCHSSTAVKLTMSGTWYTVALARVMNYLGLGTTAGPSQEQWVNTKTLCACTLVLKHLVILIWMISSCPIPIFQTCDFWGSRVTTNVEDTSLTNVASCPKLRFLDLRYQRNINYSEWNKEIDQGLPFPSVDTHFGQVTTIRHQML